MKKYIAFFIFLFLGVSISCGKTYTMDELKAEYNAKYENSTANKKENKEKKETKNKIVEMKYDEFDDYYSYDIPKIKLLENLSLNVYWASKIKNQKPDNISFLFTSTFEDWTFMGKGNHDVVFLINSDVRISKETKWDGYVKSGYVFESVSFNVSLSELKLIANAKTCKFKIGIEKFNFSYDLRENLRKMIDDIERMK